MSIVEIIIEVRKQRVKFKHIFLNEDMYDALTVNGHKVKASLERKFDCHIFKSVTKVTLPDVDLKYFNSYFDRYVNVVRLPDGTFMQVLDDVLKVSQLNKQQVTKPASYEDILNAL